MKKCFYALFVLFVLVSLIFVIHGNTFARKVIAVDSGTNIGARGFLNNAEGFERQSIRAGDTVFLGGRLDSALRHVRNGDTLIIIAHGAEDGKSFVWGGVRYTGFGSGANQYPVPGGFDTLRNVYSKLNTCYSAKDPDGNGPDKPLTKKIVIAMGDSIRGNTSSGFTGFASAASNFSLKGKGANKDTIKKYQDSAVKVVKNQQYFNQWKPYPPKNRVPPVAVNQETRIQRVIDSLLGAGKVNVINFKYTPIKNVTQSIRGEDTCTCHCELDSLCGCADVEVTTCTVCILDGPSEVMTNSNFTFYGPTENGFWTIYNYPPCNASIVGSNTGDSINIAAGSAEGYFDLIFQSLDSCGDTVCVVPIGVFELLPVELASFTYFLNDRNVTLLWTTVSEENNSGFEIQRMYGDATDQWSNVGFVQGRGNSNENTEYTFVDRNLTSGRYFYRLKQIDFNGNSKYFNLQTEVNVGVPVNFVLYQNYPNPFNPKTKIKYDIPADEMVSLKIFDINGKEVIELINQFHTAGYYTREFSINSSDYEMNSGIYFYRLKAGNFVSVKKLVVVK